MREETTRLGLDRPAQRVFWAAVAIRLAFAVVVPISEGLSGGRYVEPARCFLAGRFLDPQTVMQLPGAPLVFAACGVHFALIGLVQQLMGLTCLYLLMRLAQEAFAHGATAGALIAGQLVIPYQERFLLSETVGQFFLVCALWAAYRLHKDWNAGARHWLWAGALPAFAGLTRGEFFFLGPVLALALWLGRPKLSGSGSRVFLYAAPWALLYAGWLGHNSLAGFNGFNAHGPTVLLDTARSMVRYDLPTQPLVKKVFREQLARCGGCGSGQCPGCSGDDRATTIGRLQTEFGMPPLQAYAAVGSMAREAAFSRPLRFLPLVLDSFRKYLIPSAWMKETPELRAVLALGPLQRAFFRGIQLGPQYLGWIPMLLCWLTPWVLRRADSEERWTAWLMLAAVLSTAGTASVFRTTGRTQAALYLPLGVLAALTVKTFGPAWRRRAQRVSGGLWAPSSSQKVRTSAAPSGS